MTETGPTLESAKSPEVPKASNALMLHLAHGESDASKTAQLKNKPKPTEISQHTFDALNANHQDVRKQQQEAFYAQTRQHDAQTHAETPDELLREFHFVAWSKIEKGRIMGMFAQQQNNIDGMKAIQQALGKLHIAVGITNEGKVDVSTLLEQLYVPAPAGQPGKFYNEFCTGNTNQKLLGALDEQDIVTLRDFLTDTLGSKTAYDALLATKQTQDALKANHDFSSGSTALAENEKPILGFLQKGEVLMANASSTSQQVSVENLTLLAAATEDEKKKKLEK